MQASGILSNWKVDFFWSMKSLFFHTGLGGRAHSREWRRSSIFWWRHFLQRATEIAWLWNWWEVIFLAAISVCKPSLELQTPPPPLHTPPGALIAMQIFDWRGLLKLDFTSPNPQHAEGEVNLLDCPRAGCLSRLPFHRKEWQVTLPSDWIAWACLTNLVRIIPLRKFHRWGLTKIQVILGWNHFASCKTSKDVDHFVYNRRHSQLLCKAQIIASNKTTFPAGRWCEEGFWGKVW